MSERKEYWKRVIEEAERNLRDMAEERREREIELQDLNLEIMQLEQLLSSLAPLVAEEPSDSTIRAEGVADLELADAIREVLRQSDQYRTPRGVRDSLRVSGYDLEQHPNPLAAIHGVLKRLTANGEIDQLNTKGKTYYRWKDKDVLKLLKTDLDNIRTKVREKR